VIGIPIGTPGTAGPQWIRPTLYYRAGRDMIYGPDVLEEGSPEHTRMRAIRTKMAIPPVMDDVGAMLAFLEQQNEVKGARSAATATA
jgi:carboxymethylenebutenolidase